MTNPNTPCCPNPRCPGNKPQQADERTDWKQWGKDMNRFVDTLENPPVANSALAALLDSVLDPFIEQWEAEYKKARKEMPDGAEVYGSSYDGIVGGLTIAKVQLKKALEASNEAARCAVASKTCARDANGTCMSHYDMVNGNDESAEHPGKFPAETTRRA